MSVDQKHGETSVEQRDEEEEEVSGDGEGREKRRERIRVKSSIAGLFRYAEWVDIVLMVLGTAGAIGDGMSTNCLLIFASQIMNSLGRGDSEQSHGGFMDRVEECSVYFVYLGLAVWVVAFMEGYCWSRTSERQVMRIRYKYLEAILRQEVGYFDSQETTASEIIDSLSKDTSLIQEVLSEKVPTFLMHTSVFISGIGFCTYFSWRLAILAFPFLPLLIIPGLIYGKYLLYMSNKSYEEYNKASSIVEQALGSIRTINAFTAERTIIDKYSTILERTVKLGMKQGLAKGLAVGSTGVSFAIWAFLAWYGSRLAMHRGESGGRIWAAGITFILGGLSLGIALPEVKHFTEASIAAARIFKRIDRVPEIDTEEEKGIMPEKIQGNIEFRKITFAYPSRPDSICLKNFDLSVQARQNLALVGRSGCGKSTLISILQRFYDVLEGEVRIDGVCIRDLQLKWLRGNMGLVSQDHALFGTSIRENIMFGKADATMEEVIAAAMTANAHGFIIQLPEGYETKVGHRGSQLSGGQKQRIAIARAIIKNPPILLLDEATSALDSESEQIVQNALDQASMGRTTLTIAHRLSTIRNAHQIAVMENGHIIEKGSHKELINKENSLYSHFLSLQQAQFNPDAQDPNESSSFPARKSSGRRQSFQKSSPYTFHKTPSFKTSADLPPMKTPSFYRLASMLNNYELIKSLMGIVSATIFGAIQPVYALTIGAMISAFFTQSHEEMEGRIKTYCFIFLSLSIASFVVNLSQHYNFGCMGESLTRRIRLRMLDKILSFEVAWFDEDRNSGPAICARLGSEASVMKTLIADRVSLLVQTVSAVTISMVMGLVIAWRLALVIIAVQPLTISCFYTRKVLLSRLSSNSIKAQSESSNIASEAVSNHRIITSFSCNKMVMRVFKETLEKPMKASVRKSWMAGIGMGTAQCLTFMSWALDFWYGGKLVERGSISAGDVFKTFFILVSTGKVIAEAGSMTSDLARGATSLTSVFQILERETLIKGDGGLKLNRFNGEIEMRDVEFAYPSRPRVLVLNGFSVRVKGGTWLGLVGRSGCGKSTVVGLVQRFYDVQRGVIRVDGVDVREMDLRWFRERVGMVGQEAVIFSGSIKDNIQFGKAGAGAGAGAGASASESEVVEAAKAARAHEFISSLKDGYLTECGERGIQLSGGQKQRIGIARAILRNPRILLLDEATSALDAQSEHTVNIALETVMKGKTCLVVTHRLNTIDKVDTIAFVADGKVVEQGTPAYLKAKKGHFSQLLSFHTSEIM
ncbi:hypothetical protein AMTRI_Chr05g58120 [Amborella trichopoda]